MAECFDGVDDQMAAALSVFFTWRVRRCGKQTGLYISMLAINVLFLVPIQCGSKLERQLLFWHMH